jgi:hypothetical protein
MKARFASVERPTNGMPRWASSATRPVPRASRRSNASIAPLIRSFSLRRQRS